MEKIRASGGGSKVLVDGEVGKEDFEGGDGTKERWEDDVLFQPKHIDVARLDGVVDGVFESWMGDLDRVEMVKTLRCCCTREKAVLSDKLVETVVKDWEEAEKFAVEGKVDNVWETLKRVLSNVENCAPIWFRFGVVRLIRDLRCKAPLSSSPALRYFKYAIACEPRHTILPNLVDLHLRIASGVPVPPELFSVVSYPKSRGDIRMLAELALCNPENKSVLDQINRLHRSKIAKKFKSCK